MIESLGVLAHRGGLLVDHPELRVGMVQATCRPTGLEVELIARRPLDRRSATERQADIRAGRLGPPPAERRLLPAYDEGMDLRVGWLDRNGAARFAYGGYASGSGDHYEGTHGPSIRTRLTFPAQYDECSLVLAWPEIGFPEAVVRLPLPDRDTVERETASVWQAPAIATAVGEPLSYRDAGMPPLQPPVETGRVVAGPQVLARNLNAVIVLNRLTMMDSVLSLELASLVNGAAANAIVATMFPPPARMPPFAEDTGERVRADGPVVSAAVLGDRYAYRMSPETRTSSGGDEVFESTAEFVIEHPEGGAVNGGSLDFVVAWPAAGIPDMRASITTG